MATSWFQGRSSTDRIGEPDYLLVGGTLLLVVIGLLVLASASSQASLHQADDSYYYLRHQIYYGLTIGLVGFLVAAKVFYGTYNRRIISIAVLALSLIATALVFTPLGITAKGATRWLELGPFSFQPAELLKIGLVIYLASWLAYKDHRQRSLTEGLLPLAGVLSLVTGVLILQHSTSPVVILIGVAMAMYFTSGAKLRYLAAIVLVGAVALGAIVMTSPYRAQRVLTFLHPEVDADGGGYQLLQAKTAISTGAITGVGYGQSRIKERLPEAMGDSIFAVVGEEFGFIGAALLICGFAALVLRLLYVAQRIMDPFGRLLLVGFAVLIGFQAFINMGAMIGILPLTGTPLPFVSYGGTALAIFMTMMGIAVNILRYRSR